MSRYRISDSGFVARGGNGPQRDKPQDWVVWHFTHIENLKSIAHEGLIKCSSEIEPNRNVANPDVKARRARRKVDPDEDYPTSFVNDHVPFYIAAKSPMLYSVTNGHKGYDGGCESLIFFGSFLGDIIESRRIWCASDSNAATSYVKFSRDEKNLGSFVDFDLLLQRYWGKTSEDPDRPGRRAAEILVLKEFPVDLISLVVAKNASMLEKAKLNFEKAGTEFDFRCEPRIYF
ncbi:DUF4433 domain-containing protein [Nocardiopsis sp. EMB25]|uniref:type II toxin-antitoxin system toxin DNA ADP-ribosyl transferase DarT n=1 Tax=Nocardiopsis sp. EMB25 TaxID=2835867 RepID=UPI0022833128|nr:DUF4433 domain-containing protein [Nocardiopsis sp. EMB25]MCY9786683.1 DUF4433 domain-containing protein [Nocardiopsis sp. EMB25]